MLLATTDDRDPLTAAIAAAKRNSHAECAKWQEDLTVMTAELSTKFFGTRSVEMIRSGLAMAVKLLGLGLLEQSQGTPDVPLWLQALERLGIKGVTALAIERIKLVARLDPGLQRALLFEGKSWFDRFVSEATAGQSSGKGQKTSGPAV